MGGATAVERGLGRFGMDWAGDAALELDEELTLVGAWSPPRSLRHLLPPTTEETAPTVFEVLVSGWVTAPPAPTRLSAARPPSPGALPLWALGVGLVAMTLSLWGSLALLATAGMVALTLLS
jgi:hypothetical protein